MNQTDLTLNTHVYTPSGTTAGNGVWTNRDSGVATGFSTVSAKVKDNPSSPVYRLEWDLTQPRIASSDTSCSCAGSVLRTDRSSLTILVPRGDTLAERTDLALKLKDLVATTAFQNAIINLEPFTG